MIKSRTFISFILLTIVAVFFAAVALGCSVDEEDYAIDYLPEIDAKIERINNIEKENDITERLFFITDLHWESNSGKSPQIINYIKSHTPVKTIVFGGDYIAHFYSDKEYALSLMGECVSSFGTNDYYAILGNHEYNQDSSASTPRITENEANIVLNEARFDKPYFAVDDEKKHICKIFLDTNIFVKDEEQYNWLKNKLLSLGADKTVLIFMHIYNDYNYPGVPLTIAPQGELLNNMLDDIADEMVCSIGGIFSGHTHRDFMSQNSLGYTVLSTACDAIDSYYACDDLYDRNRGEVSEQVFDVVQIDTSNRKVFLTRIGAGYDREYSY